MEHNMQKKIGGGVKRTPSQTARLKARKKKKTVSVSIRSSKTGKVFYRTLQFPGEAYFIGVPMEFIRELGLKKGDTLAVGLGIDGVLFYQKSKQGELFGMVRK